ncbi:hypothetical protein AAY473_002192 [Plecturocebus cupreus]
MTITTNVVLRLDTVTHAYNPSTLGGRVAAPEPREDLRQRQNTQNFNRRWIFSRLGKDSLRLVVELGEQEDKNPRVRPPANSQHTSNPRMTRQTLRREHWPGRPILIIQDAPRPVRHFYPQVILKDQRTVGPEENIQPKHSADLRKEDSRKSCQKKLDTF